MTTTYLELIDRGARHYPERTALVFGVELQQRAEALQAALPKLVCLGLDAHFGAGHDLVAEAATHSTSAPPIAVAPDDVVLTLFTSGTTGTLKAAQHTQASFAAICKNVLLNLIAVQHDDAMLHAASLIHASGVFVLLFWLRGAKAVIITGGYNVYSRVAAYKRPRRVVFVGAVPKTAVGKLNRKALRYTLV